MINGSNGTVLIEESRTGLPLRSGAIGPGGRTGTLDTNCRHVAGPDVEDYILFKCVNVTENCS